MTKMTLFRERFENSFENIVFVAFVFLLVGLPLAVDVGAYLTFEPIKVHVLSIGAGLLAGLGLVGWAYGLRRKSIAGAAVTAPSALLRLTFYGYWSAVFLSTVVSIAPMVSLWGVDPRYHGLLYYGALFIMVLVAGYLRRERIVKLLEIIMVTAIIVSVYGILQRIFPVLTEWWDVDSFLYRSFSTLGHPNYLADYLVLVTPLFFWKFLESRRWWLWLIGGAVVLLALLLTLSRSGLIGLFVSFLLIAIVYSRMDSRADSRTSWRKVGAGVLIVVGLMTALIIFANVRERAGFTYSRDLLSRLVIAGENVRSLETRLILWPATVKMILERPILGYGPDTYAMAFTRFAPKELLRAENLNSYADRAHNIILDTMQEIGIIGGLFFLIILFLAISRAVRSQNLVVIALGASLAGHLASQQFGFQTAPHALTMWFFIVAIFSLEQMEQPHSPHALAKKGATWIRILSLIFFFLIIGGVIYGTGRVWRADRVAREEHYQEAIAMAPMRIRYALNHVRQFPDFPLLERIQAFTNGEDYRVYWYRARAYIEAGEFELAHEQYLNALKLAPTAIEVWYAYADGLFQQGDYTAAITAWNQYIRLSPDYWRQHEAYRAGLLTPWERNRYEVFYKLYPNFDEVFDRVEDAERAAESELQTRH